MTAAAKIGSVGVRHAAMTRDERNESLGMRPYMIAADDVKRLSNDDAKLSAARSRTC